MELSPMESRPFPQRLPEGKGKEEVNGESVVKIGVAQHSEAQSWPSLPHAESSTSQRGLTKDKGEIERHDDARITIELPPKTSGFGDYVRSLVERAKPKCFIHKVHSGLTDASAKHYEPVLLSIGPYHHGKTPLQDMEKHKLHYSNMILDTENESIERYITAYLYDGVQEALDCYRDIFKMDLDSFGKSLVLDGLFMIELFRRNKKPGEDGETLRRNDMLFKIRWMKPLLARDMLLFENQIPLFVLRIMFTLTEQKVEEGDLVESALEYFEFCGRPVRFSSILKDRLDNIPHLLGLVYHALVSETQEQPKNEQKTSEFIRTAAALEEVGVKFVAKAGDSFYDFDFCNGVLSIPRLVINDNTESIFRNLVAYEQYSDDYSLHKVADYLRVMDCLINSPKDVELLRHRGIIDNRIGDDVKVSTMFNKLCSGVYFDQDRFFYAQMFNDVNEFCKKRRNVWMAKLKTEYFGSPWTLISFLAALMLLLLTAAQTVYSVLSYYKS